MKKKTALEVIASLLILLFVYTALSKLYDIPRFQWVLGKSPLLKSSASFVAWFVPILELGISALLLFPRTRNVGLISSFALLTIFTLYIGYMVLFVPKLPCNCGGVIQQLTWQQHLIFNSVFILLAGLGISLTRTSESLAPKAEVA
jgi:hypothetical protein